MGRSQLDSDPPEVAPACPRPELSSPALQLAVVGAGTVDAGPLGVCDSECALVGSQFERVDLVARPASSHEFAGWSGSCEGTGACAMWLDDDLSVTAEFAPL